MDVRVPAQSLHLLRLGGLIQLLKPVPLKVAGILGLVQIETGTSQGVSGGASGTGWDGAGMQEAVESLTTCR